MSTFLICLGSRCPVMPTFRKGNCSGSFVSTPVFMTNFIFTAGRGLKKSQLCLGLSTTFISGEQLRASWSVFLSACTNTVKHRMFTTDSMIFAACLVNI